MIQLSSLSASSSEIAGKTADFPLLKGEFERLLSSETGDEALPGGKMLPDAGKDLPEGLPTVELAPLASRTLVGALTVKCATGPEPKAEGSASADDTDLPVEPEPEAASAVATVKGEAIDGSGVPLVRTLVVDPAGPAPAVDVESAISEEPTTKPGAAAVVPVRTDRCPTTSPKAAPGIEGQQLAVALPVPKAPSAPVLDPSVSSDGKRPADAPQPPRIAPGHAEEPVAEIRLQLSAGANSEGSAHSPGERRGGAPAALAAHSLSNPTPQPAVLEVATVQADAPVVRDSAAPAPSQAQGIRPHDLTTLVDRLVEARENARSAQASLSVMHAEFGRVSMHFAHDQGNLTVSLANNDPGFVRAVNAAAATDAGMNNETQAQPDRRGDGSPGSGPSAGPRASGGEPGDRGNHPRGERHQHEHDGPTAEHSRRKPANPNSGSRGVFA